MMDREADAMKRGLIFVAMKRIDTGPILGIGLEVPILRKYLFIKGRYRIGLTNLVTGFPGAPAARTRSLTIIGGYELN
jgi:hypothetical protein